jgi:hypothetical protein
VGLGRRFGHGSLATPDHLEAGDRPGRKSRRTPRSRPGGGQPYQSALDDDQPGVPPKHTHTHIRAHTHSYTLTHSHTHPHSLDSTERPFAQYFFLLLISLLNSSRHSTPSIWQTRARRNQTWSLEEEKNQKKTKITYHTSQRGNTLNFRNQTLEPAHHSG